MPRHHPCLAPLPAPLGLRFRALLGLGFVPPPGPSPAPIAPPSPTRCSRHPRPPLALRRPRGPSWQEPRRMHPFFAECAKKAPFLATSARNACFSRSRWQHPRPMHPFPGAIGRFRIHGARILPPRALFRVEEPEITHGAKMLPAPPGLSAVAACGPAERALRPAAAACGPAERALRPAARAWPACRMRPCHLARVHRRRLTRVVLRCPHRAHRAPPSAASPIAVGVSRLSGSSCRPRAAHADASRPSMRARRHRLGPDPREPSPSPEPTGPQPRASRVPAHPWSRLRPSAPCHPPRLALPRGSRCGSGNSREMVR